MLNREGKKGQAGLQGNACSKLNTAGLRRRSWVPLRGSSLAKGPGHWVREGFGGVTKTCFPWPLLRWVEQLAGCFMEGTWLWGHPLLLSNWVTLGNYSHSPKPRVCICKMKIVIAGLWWRFYEKMHGEHWACCCRHMVFTSICDLPLPVTTGQESCLLSTNRSTLDGVTKKHFSVGKSGKLVTKNIVNSDAKRFPLTIFFFFTAEGNLYSIPL